MFLINISETEQQMSDDSGISHPRIHLDSRQDSLGFRQRFSPIIAATLFFSTRESTDDFEQDMKLVLAKIRIFSAVAGKEASNEAGRDMGTYPIPYSDNTQINQYSFPQYPPSSCQYTNQLSFPRHFFLRGYLSELDYIFDYSE